MKAKLILIIAALALALPSFAQKNHDKKDHSTKRKEMLEFKLKYLADEIDLKEDQKKQFNELYTQMEAERRAVFKRIKQAEKSISDKKDATEADYEKATIEINNARAEISRIDAKYDAKFAKFLTKKQLYKLKEAENKYIEKVRNCRDKKIKEKK